MPLVFAAGALVISGFDSYLKWRQTDKTEKMVTSQTLLLAAAIASAMFFAVKAARR